MKIYVSLTVILFLFLESTAQNHPLDTTLLSRLQTRANYYLRTYKCCDTSGGAAKCSECPTFLQTNGTTQIVLPRVLDSSFVPIFNTVILNNDNSINVGSAGSIVQDEKAGTLNVNYAYKIKNGGWFDYFNVGVGAESNGGIWDLYSSNSWRSGISTTFGFTHFGKYNKQFLK